MPSRFSKTLFTSAILASGTTVLAWNSEFNYAPWMTQKQYEQKKSAYEYIAQKALDYYASKMPVHEGHTADEIDPDTVKGFGSEFQNLVECTVCEGGIRIVQDLFRSDFFVTFVEKLLSDVCFLGQALIEYSACTGFVDLSVPTITDSLAAFLVSPEYSCQIELSDCSRDWYTLLNVKDYISQILAHKPDYLANDNFLNNIYQQVLKDTNPRKTLSIVQFTDMHLDLEYTVGANTKCDNVLCCRAENGFAEDPSMGAGEFGSIAFCDIPESVVFKMGDKINELAPDLVFWTGDAVPHDQWEYSLEHVQKYQDWLVDFINANLSQWSIVPLEGNHDFGEVINSQDFTQTDPMITYNLNLWKKWLTPSAQEQFAVNGFYSMPLTTSDGTLHEKVRVIAVNTEACYNMNYFLMKLRDDPGDQLKWLEETLYEMEANGEIAILIGHHPPGDGSCLTQWSQRFQALMERYQNIVRLNFFGHVHTEQHNVIRSTTTDKAVGVHFWTGSLSTYSFTYPTFRHFVVDAETWIPLKVETYLLDPEAENPEFVLDHELTEFYDMPDLSPASFDELAQRMLNDEDLALKYIRTQSNQGPKTAKDSCDETCRLGVFCQTSNSVYWRTRECMGETDKSWVNDPINTLMESLSDPWYSYQAHPII